KKSPRQSADMQRRTGVPPVCDAFVGFIFSGRQARRRSYEFRPDFAEPLPLAVVVAENVHGVTLAPPAMELLEKLPALRFGHRRFGRAFGKRTISLERREERTAELRIGGLLVGQIVLRRVRVRRSH